jgi:hypothetical protein
LAGNYNLKNPAFRQMLGQAGLKPIAGHFPMDRITGDTEAVAKECQELGIRYVGAAWIKGKGEFDIEAAHTIAETKAHNDAIAERIVTLGGLAVRTGGGTTGAAALKLFTDFNPEAC